MSPLIELVGAINPAFAAAFGALFVEWGWRRSKIRRDLASLSSNPDPTIAEAISLMNGLDTLHRNRERWREVGLLGTVAGIFSAFVDLDPAQFGGGELMMHVLQNGLSLALATTLVGQTMHTVLGLVDTSLEQRAAALQRQSGSYGDAQTPQQ